MTQTAKSVSKIPGVLFKQRNLFSCEKSLRLYGVLIVFVSTAGVTSAATLPPYIHSKLSKVFLLTNSPTVISKFDPLNVLIPICLYVRTSSRNINPAMMMMSVGECVGCVLRVVVVCVAVM